MLSEGIVTGPYRLLLGSVWHIIYLHRDQKFDI